MVQAIPLITLNDGAELPNIGLGTYNLNGPAGVASLVSAIDLGYRLLDSAFNYENEGTVGASVRAANVQRTELLITSKLPGRHYHYDRAIEIVYESLFRTGLDYIDVYLLHWPNPGSDLYLEAWRALVEVQQRGIVRSIGVCNFLPEHLERVIADSGVTPSINQIELHPYFPQVEQCRFNESLGVQTQSWSPLGRGTALLDEPVLGDIAATLNRTPAQIVLRWHVQLRSIPLPKAANAERQRENLEIFDFELNQQQLLAISTMARADGRIANQNPAFYEEF